MITKEMIDEQCHKLALTLIQKNHDYGNSVQEQFKEYGPMSLALRIEDKLRRFKHLMKHPRKVISESIKDTLLDLAGYAIMGYICLTLEEQEENE